MATWEDLDNEYNEEEVNLALIASTYMLEQKWFVQFL
jgi:hypothetical protein